MEMQDMLADRLKQKRALSHASLEEYSKELWISKSALQKYEAGTGNPTLATVQTIADHLHESPAQLLGMYSEEEMEAAGLMFRTLEWSMGLSEGSRRELAVLFRELSRFLSGELGGAPGTPKERKEER